MKRSALDGLMQYAAKRKQLMIYPSCERMGWDVGSGSTESMCNTMTRRLKLRGMRWDADHAEAMMALETLEQRRAFNHVKFARQIHIQQRADWPGESQPHLPDRIPALKPFSRHERA